MFDIGIHPLPLIAFLSGLWIGHFLTKIHYQEKISKLTKIIMGKHIWEKQK